MIKKTEISDEQRKRIIDKAGRLSDEFGAKYMACAPGIFEGIAEAFRDEGIEIFPLEIQKALTRGLSGFMAVSPCPESAPAGLLPLLRF